MLFPKRQEGQSLVEFALIMILTAIVVIAILLLLGGSITGCAPVSAQKVETEQQQAGQMEIVRNQPVPNLNGYSLERDIVSQVLQARNSGINTYTYLISEYTGKVIKICDSIGLPIPYATQLTAPEAEVINYSHYVILPQPEPNGLYSPESAEATIIPCIGENGTIIPLYFEPRVFSLPYEIHADIVLSPITKSNLNIKTGQ